MSLVSILWLVSPSSFPYLLALEKQSIIPSLSRWETSAHLMLAVTVSQASLRTHHDFWGMSFSRGTVRQLIF
ncbi:hypothetical protein QR685DRAFT_529442 [Neurospora intermedia]|uniref:Secreted protein n=1 Tax=Neurospora intermedia TaxID=5142 RepID=A0ABR3D8K1_NEUIN